MAVITVDTSLMGSEGAWIAYNSGVQAFLRLRGVPLMRSNESVSDALSRAPGFIRCTNDGIEFRDQGIAEQLLGCLKRTMYGHSPALESAFGLL